MEQRVNIKFCYKLGKTAMETREMLVQVYRREAMSRKCVYEWLKCFREGEETTEDEPCSGQPSTSRTPEMIKKVWQMLAQDQQLMLRLIAEELDFSKDMAHTIVHDDWVSGRSATNFCCTSSQTNRKQNGWTLLETSFPCVTRIQCFWKTSSWEMRPGSTSSIQNQNGNRWRGVHQIPHDQKRVICKNPRSKHCWLFFDNKGIIHKEFVPVDQFINAAFYQAVLN